MRFLRQLSSAARPLHPDPLISIRGATVYPLGDTQSPYFTDLNWEIRERETWAVVGPSTSGRRVLLEALS